MPQERYIDRKFHKNGVVLALTPECPRDIEDALVEFIQESGALWIPRAMRKDTNPSRRDIHIIPKPDGRGRWFVMKKKQRKDRPMNDAEDYSDEYWRWLAFFTQSIGHEIIMSHAFSQIVDEFNDINTELILHDGKEYQPIFCVQQCYGGLIEQGKNGKRFGIFEFVPGISPRNETAMASDGFSYGWNALPEVDRLLFGKMQTLLNRLSQLSLSDPYFVEPWDLGVHQLLYRVDELNQKIHITILDTEEYLDIQKHGSYWPSIFTTIGLPPVLMDIQGEYSD